MTRYVSGFVCAWLWLAHTLFCPAIAGFAVTPLYVATTGDDANPGSIEKPFATIEGARNAIRDLKQKGTFNGPVTVDILGGIYLLKQGLVFDAQDSGEPGKEIVYRAKLGEKVRLFGGTQLHLSDFVAVSDGAVLNRLDPGARGHVLQLAFTDRQGSKPARFPDLFDNGGGLFRLQDNDKIMPLSRWPKKGYAPISEVIDSGILPGHQPSFISKSAPLERWHAAWAAGNLWITCFWRVPWVIQSVRVQSIDTTSQVITLAKNVGGGIGSKYGPVVNGTRKGSGKEPYYVMNLPEELTSPGEWCYDFAANTLYFWPPDQTPNPELLISNLNEPLINLQNTGHLFFVGLDLEGGLEETVRISGGEQNTIAACDFHDTGGIGVNITAGKGHSVVSCNFEHIGDTAISLVAGNKITLEPGNCLAENNHIHDIGEVTKVVPAIYMDGVGNRASHNLIHDVPNAGFRYEGNDQLMNFNEIHNVGLDSGDLGAFYSSGDWAAQGNRIESNLVHNALDANGSYIDDGGSGRSVIGNIFYRCASGLFVGGGHDNIMKNNIIMECNRGVHIDDRGLARGYDQSNKNLSGRLSSFDPNSPPWSIKYPNFLANILKDPKLPTGNVVEDNIIINCKKPWDISMPNLIDTKNNLTLKDNTMFPDAEHLNFAMTPGDPNLSTLPNFKPISNPAQIGLYLDDYRKAYLGPLPTAEETGRYESRMPAQLFDSVTDMKQSNQLGK